MTDYYMVLGVPRGVDTAQIKNAYRKIALECHPDRTANDKTKTEQFRLATEAYAILGDPTRRRQYDDELSSGGKTGLAGSMFGPMFDELIGRITKDGVHSGNIDTLIKDVFGVARDFQARMPAKAKQATNSPGNLLDFVEQMFDTEIKVGGQKK